MLQKCIVILLLTCLFQDSIAVFRGPRPKLVIDHDGGADDAMAITMMLRYERYFSGPQVVALTTTHGNVNVSQAIVNSGRILNLAQRREVPIYAGSEHALIKGADPDFHFGSDGLSDNGYVPNIVLRVRREHASIALIDLSKRYEGKLIIVAIGPLTNIALAQKLDPYFISRLKHLYVGAGNIYDEENPSKSEFNAKMDPEAYYIVAEAATPETVTFVPSSQIKSSLNITKDWRENVLGAIKTPLMKALNSFEKMSFAKKPNWSPLDSAVAAIALKDSMIKDIRKSNNSIILCGDKRGITTNDLSSTTPNSKIIYAADVEVYKELLIDIYNAELASFPHWF